MMLQPLQLILIICLAYLYYKLTVYGLILKKAHAKRKDHLGENIATLAGGLARVSFPFVAIIAVDYTWHYGIYDFQAMFLSMGVAVFIVIGYSLLPHLYIKLASAVKNNHSSKYALISIVQTVIFIVVGWWFGSHFNRGHLTFRAIQLVALYMVFEALYELWFLFSRKSKKFTMVGIVMCCLYIASLAILPLDRLFVFDWNTLQSIPVDLGLYYLISKSILNAATAIGLRGK